MRGKACSAEFMKTFAAQVDRGNTTKGLCQIYCMKGREIRVLKSALATQRKIERQLTAALPLQPTHYAEIAQAPEEAQADIARQAAEGKWSVKRVREAVKEAQRLAQDGHRPEQDLPPNCEILHSDLADAVLEPRTIDAIITDPPYSLKYLALYETLAKQARHWLKPGGVLLTMVGQSYLPEILALMTPYIEYHWTLAYLTPGGQSAQLWQRKINTFWKPVLWFVNGLYNGNWVGDVIKSAVNDNDKRYHQWGQSESGMAQLVEHFTKSGDTILDPFLGGGATGAVALKLGRNFIGIDSDAAAVDTARGRLACLLAT